MSKDQEFWDCQGGAVNKQADCLEMNISKITFQYLRKYQVCLFYTYTHMEEKKVGRATQAMGKTQTRCICKTKFIKCSGTSCEVYGGKQIYFCLYFRMIITSHIFLKMHLLLQLTEIFFSNLTIHFKFTNKNRKKSLHSRIMDFNWLWLSLVWLGFSV